MTIPAAVSIPLEEAGDTFPGPFEGPEKLLEVWFAPSFDALPVPSTPLRPDISRRGTLYDLQNGAEGQNGGPSKRYRGLRTVPRKVWEEMLDIVKCKVLSVVEGEELDAYLLSESSLFVAPHLLILKTCGTTLNLLGLHRIIEIAREYCGFTNVWRCFYSRKSFFFPERQSGPHRDWRDEVNFLDSVFGSAGSAYTVGPMNRDHWLLYLTSPNTQPLLPSDAALSSLFKLSMPSSLTPPTYQDHTLEILMTHLSPTARAPFLGAANLQIPLTSTATASNDTASSSSSGLTGHEMGSKISSTLGIDKLFPKHETRLDSYGFDPCGYSANAVIGTGMPPPSGSTGPGGGYYTIHVTPEEGWSYASFECNVPLPFNAQSATATPGASQSPHMDRSASQPQIEAVTRPDLSTLIRNVVNIFQPGRLSITLFVSTPPADSSSPSNAQPNDTEARAWQSFTPTLLGKEYERKDRIGYEFDGYDLVFACFERKGFIEVKQ